MEETSGRGEVVGAGGAFKVGVSTNTGKVFVRREGTGVGENTEVREVVKVGETSHTGGGFD